MNTPFASELIATANAIVSPGRGILAADESTGTIGKRFEAIGVENTEENRRAYRELLVTTPGLGQFVSGFLVFEETLTHKAADGTSLVDIAKKAGMIVGIKVDKGTVPIPGTDGETDTQGHTDLGARCAKYYQQGARFAKWRAVIKISSSGCPSDIAIKSNCDGLSRYAAICQMNGLVPIVEPEILMDGDFSIEVSAAVTQKVLSYQYRSLAEHNVILEGTLLKPNMVRPGEGSKAPFDPAAIARATVRVLQHTLPVAVPGVTFLSGGMGEEDASIALNEINKFEGKKPWVLTFSYGRALQQSVLHVWKGKAENTAAAQKELSLRAQANSEAALGKYKGNAGGALAKASLHVAGYVY